MENCTEIQLKAWKCNNCGHAYTDERMASVCCKQYHCETCGCETHKYYLECDSCKEQRDYAKATKMSYAEYCEKFPKNMICFGENFYSELEELVDEFYDEENMENIPEYCWGTEELEIKIDADSVLDSLINDCAWEDAEFDDGAYKEFRKFADEWNKKYSISYFMQTNIAIPITEEFKEKYV